MGNVVCFVCVSVCMCVCHRIALINIIIYMFGKLLSHSLDSPILWSGNNICLSSFSLWPHSQYFMITTTPYCMTHRKNLKYPFIIFFDLERPKAVQGTKFNGMEDIPNFPGIVSRVSFITKILIMFGLVFYAIVRPMALATTICFRIFSPFSNWSLSSTLAILGIIIVQRARVCVWVCWFYSFLNGKAAISRVSGLLSNAWVKTS